MKYEVDKHLHEYSYKCLDEIDEHLDLYENSDKDMNNKMDI